MKAVQNSLETGEPLLPVESKCSLSSDGVVLLHLTKKVIVCLVTSSKFYWILKNLQRVKTQRYPEPDALPHQPPQASIQQLDTLGGHQRNISWFVLFQLMQSKLGLNSERCHSPLLLALKSLVSVVRKGKQLHHVLNSLCPKPPTPTIPTRAI